ncbi:MAG: hypothetical protein KGH65_02600 [Candidatus Micrarchaeota archaeon]|nr:hypothetical protein [Candidatus Micrarchaeota archaeon]
MRRKRKVNREGWEPQGRLKIEGMLVNVERRKGKKESYVMGVGEWEHRVPEGLKFIIRDRKKFDEAHILVSEGGISVYGFHSASYGKVKIPDRESRKIFGAKSIIEAYGLALAAAENSFWRRRKELEGDKRDAVMREFVDIDIKRVLGFARDLATSRANSLDRFLPKIRK